MPAELFGAVSQARHVAGHRAGAVPISVALHAVVLVAVVVIPLLATGVLPAPRVQLHWQQIPSIPVVTTPVAPRPVSRGPVALRTGVPQVPFVAPDGIRPEDGVVRLPAVTEMSPSDLGTIVGNGERAIAEAEPPPPPAPPKKVAPVRVGVVSPPRKIHHQAPVYPMTAILTKVQGTVVVEAIIATDGTVQDVRVVQSIPLLDAAAIEAVRHWTFTPTLLSGVPVPVVMTVRVEFKLTR